jgi:hypothetical protein
LKDSYRSEKKRLSEEDPSGSGLEGSKRAKKRWIYFDQMGFLSKVHDDAEYLYIMLHLLYVGRQLRIFSSEIRRFTNIDDEHEEGKLNEY